MIEYKTGDMLLEPAQALVNTVNCVGVMGRGVALQFKKAFPENYKAYEQACKSGLVMPGKMFVHETHSLTSPQFIINFPTKRHWRSRSRLEDIESGLRALAGIVEQLRLESVALPALGCGLGGLAWAQVKPLIEKMSRDLPDVRFIVFEPQQAPEAEVMVTHATPARMTAGRAALIELMNKYLKGLMDPSVTLLEVHKLLYFMQVAGEPLRLRYKQGLYGPYAENLRHVLTAIEGCYLVGYADGGDAPDKELEILPDAVEIAAAVLEDYPETHCRVQRVAHLVDGFESAFGLELLSTVHWVHVTSKPVSLPELVRLTHAWGDRKRQFSPRQIEVAQNVLERKGWLN